MHLHRPHAIDPVKRTARVALAYSNAAAQRAVGSHIGLGVTALNTVATLRAAGYWAEVWPVATPAQLAKKLADAQACAVGSNRQPVSHVVINAPWIPTPALQTLTAENTDVHFAVVSHSNVGFLQADPGAIQLLRQGLELQRGTHNFTVAGNCAKFVQAFSSMYGVPIQLLPNLYDVSTMRHVGHRVPWHRGEALRVGVFGATRVLKNMVTAVAAAVELGQLMRVDVEIHMSSGRNEGGGSTRNSIAQLVAGLRHTQLVEHGWASWPQFRETVRGMHLLFSPSYTESFCNVVADGVVEGVAAVVSEAIDWVPRDWMANADDVSDIARTARRLLSDAHAVDDGQKHLRNYVATGLKTWEHYLGGQ